MMISTYCTSTLYTILIYRIVNCWYAKPNAVRKPRSSNHLCNLPGGAKQLNSYIAW